MRTIVLVILAAWSAWDHLIAPALLPDAPEPNILVLVFRVVAFTVALFFWREDN
jgi:hypothetical protein